MTWWQRGLCVAATSAIVLAPCGRAAHTAHAQPRQPGVPTPVVGRAVRFASTPPLGTLPAPESHKGLEAQSVPAKSVPIKSFRRIDEHAAPTSDAAVQALPPRALFAPQVSLSFEGLAFRDNIALSAILIAPPDTVGDVGPHHYVQMVNSAFRVFDKAGSPLGPARRLSSLWASLSGPCATRDDGDPIVLYDSVADRWLLSQFCTVGDPNTHQLIAISQTPDPTGAYYVYDFPMPNEKFNDYPKIGVWTDAYYMTDNQFDQAGTTYLGAGVFAFDRARMLAGDPSARYVYVDLATVDMSIGGVLPADLDGLTPPAAGAPGVFAYFTADEFGDPSDGLRVFEFTVDFDDPLASTFLERPESPLAVAAFNPLTPPGRDDIRQPPPSTDASALDAIADRLMHRLAYRRSGVVEWMVVTHTVSAGPATDLEAYKAGVRYYDIRRSAGGPFQVADQATFAPDADSRWMGSAATDHQGNLAVGYSVASATTFPSIRYAGRLATDPDGGLYQGESSLIEGAGSQTSTGSRWGDYSALTVDPADDCTFWYTNQYYSQESQGVGVGWLTRVGAFRFAECTPVAAGVVRGTVRDALSGVAVSGALVRSDGGHMAVADASGQFVLRVTPGTYTISATAVAYVSTGATTATVDQGETVSRDVLLMPVPVLEPATTAVLSDTCGLRTGGIDPGEVVTVDFAVVNRGTADTLNLVGTLLPGGGVTSPGEPQAFGVVRAGGDAVARPFTFTADGGLACGASITVSLDLRDGSRSFGVVVYTLTTGRESNATYPTVVSSGDRNEQIPDQGELVVPVEVAEDGVVGDVVVGLRLTHTFDADLVLELVHPDGTVIRLSNRHGGDGGFGTGENSCAGTPTVFDDAAPVAIGEGQSPFAGRFRPDMPLAGLAGKPARGTWLVRIKDVAAEDQGVLGCVTLTVNRRLVLCCPYDGTDVAAASAGSAALQGESCRNGAADPDETVTVSFPLHNVGNAPINKLVATLLPGGGVNAPSGERSYGPLDPAGLSASREFTFVPSGTCGSDITATLALDDIDGAGPLGTVSFPIRLGTDAATTTAWGDATPNAVPGGALTAGRAATYPSVIMVSGMTGTVRKVTVRLEGLRHTFPDDLDIMLVGPRGQRVLLLSDAGGSADVDATLVFDDAAAAYPPDSGPLVSGTFRPANYGIGDVFPPPAPAGPYAEPQLLSVFAGVDPNGAWSLYLNDDGAQDVGSLTGWGLSITTTLPSCCSEGCRLACPVSVGRGVDQDGCSAVVAFEPTVSGSCGVVTCTPPSSSVFWMGVTTVTCSGTTVGTGSPTSSCTFPVRIDERDGPSSAVCR